MRRFVLMSWVAVALCATTLRADQVSYMATVPTQQTNWNTLVSLAKFDPSLGTLTMVVVRLNASLDGALLAENRSNVPAVITGSITTTATLDPPTGPDLSTASSSSGPQPVAPYDGVPFTVDPNGADTAHWTFSSNNQVQQSYTSPVDLAFFTGMGTLPYGVAADTQVSLSSTTGNLAAMSMATAGAVVTVIYTYIVPEPGSIGLMLLGLGAVLYRGRRSR